MRLFVDCDDTLVLWKYVGQQDGLYYTDGYQLNQPLIEAVKAFLENTQGTTLIVWSGGGMDYARRWGRLCFPDTAYLVESKNIAYPQSMDICVDDQVLGVVATLTTPQDFVAAHQESLA